MTNFTVFRPNTQNIIVVSNIQIDGNKVDVVETSKFLKIIIMAFLTGLTIKA